MTVFKDIRDRLGVSQAVLGEALGVSQGNISLYEKTEQVMPPHMAKQLILFARRRKVLVTLDEIYRDVRPEKRDHSRKSA